MKIKLIDICEIKTALNRMSQLMRIYIYEYKFRVWTAANEVRDQEVKCSRLVHEVEMLSV